MPRPGDRVGLDGIAGVGYILTYPSSGKVLRLEYVTGGGGVGGGL